MSILNQIAIIFGISLLGEIAAYILPFTFPSQIIALIILFVLLITGVLKIEHIKEKSDFLLKNMAFFFSALFCTLAMKLTGRRESR